MHIVYCGYSRPFKPRIKNTVREDRGCNERETLSFSASRVSAHVGRQSHHLKPREKCRRRVDNKNNHFGSEQRSQTLSTLDASVIFLKNNPALANNIFDVYQCWKSKTWASTEISTFLRIMLHSLHNITNVK